MTDTDAALDPPAPGQERLVVGGLAVTAAPAVGLASCRPTGQLVLDALWRIGVGGVFVLAAARARPWTWAVAAGAAAVGGVGTVLAVPAGAALVALIAALVLDRQRPWVGAASAAVSITVLAHCP